MEVFWNSALSCGPGGPGTGFCSPGDGFSANKRSGKPLRLYTKTKRPPPEFQKQYQDHLDHPRTSY